MAQSSLPWFSLAFALVSSGLGLLHLVRLATARRDRRSAAGEFAHALMGLGMAAMFAPAGDPLPSLVWVILFGAVVAWFAAAGLRSGWRVDDAGHHVVGGVAMLFMTAAGGHAGHGTGGAVWRSLLALCFAGYFTWHVMRCADRWRHAHRPTVAALIPSSGAASTVASSVSPTNGPGGLDTGAESSAGGPCHHGPAPTGGMWRALRTPRVAAGAHLVMASSMAVMLLAML